MKNLKESRSLRSCLALVVILFALTSSVVIRSYSNSKIETQSKANKNEIVNIKKEIKELKSDYSALRNNDNKLKKEIEEKQKSISDLNNQLNDLKKN